MKQSNIVDDATYKQPNTGRNFLITFADITIIVLLFPLLLMLGKSLVWFGKLVLHFSGELTLYSTFTVSNTLIDIISLFVTVPELTTTTLTVTTALYVSTVTLISFTYLSKRSALK